MEFSQAHILIITSYAHGYRSLSINVSIYFGRFKNHIKVNQYSIAIKYSTSHFILNFNSN